MKGSEGAVGLQPRGRSRPPGAWRLGVGTSALRSPGLLPPQPAVTRSVSPLRLRRVPSPPVLRKGSLTRDYSLARLQSDPSHIPWSPLTSTSRSSLNSSEPSPDPPFHSGSHFLSQPRTPRLSPARSARSSQTPDVCPSCWPLLKRAPVELAPRFLVISALSLGFVSRPYRPSP